ncbi:hypothetical protein J4217_01040 [Candidatus Pacearchaeota archaeon]|nr:hypothetical protein [Candidatus Pacearchaeota archaeon]
MRSIAQEDSMGCGIACTACIINKSYKKTKKLFRNEKNASTKGYYCRDLTKVLKKRGLNYLYSKVRKENKNKIKNNGTIIFIKRDKKYPAGHYLIKTNRGWMNSWINFPKLPIKLGFQNKLPGKPQWIMYREKIKKEEDKKKK